MSNANEPAYPAIKTDAAYDGDGRGVPYSNVYSVGGLTKREYFAAMAMQGLLACDGERCFSAALTLKDSREERAKSAIAYADALLAELERTA